MSRNTFTSPAPLTAARFALEVLALCGTLAGLVLLVTLLHAAA